MDVEIPPWLQWVSYLAGGEWPQGSETGMARIEEHLQAAAEQLNDLIPDLNSVRNETLSVLMGATAEAADWQFAMLFDGVYAVDKLSDALTALGESAGLTSSEIEYAKWSILIGLALAAFEITLSYVMAPETGGASLARIPWIEWLTLYNTRRLIRMVAEHLAQKVRDMLARTTVRHLVHEGLQEAGEEVVYSAVQEGTIAGIQGDRYTYNPDRLTMTVISSAVGGGAGGATAVPTAGFLGPGATRGGAAAKGAATFFTAGIAGNIAGTAAVGGDLDPFMMVVSSTTSSIGGLKGVGGGHGGHTPDGQSPDTGPDTGTPPDGESPPAGPDDGGSPGAQPDDEASPVNSSNGNGQDPHSVNGARVSEPTGQHEPGASSDANAAAAQHNPATTTTAQTADHEGEANSGATQPTPPPAHAGDQGDTSPQTPEGATPSVQSNGDLSGHDANQDLSAAHTPTEPSETGQHVDGGSTDPVQAPGQDSGPDSGPESVVAPPNTDDSATTSAVADTAAPTDTPLVADPQGHAQASSAAPQNSVGPTTAPSVQAPVSSAPTTPTSAATPSSTPTTAASTPGPATTAPKPSAQQDVPQVPKATASTSETTATPAARASDTTAKAAQQNTKDDSEQLVQAPDVTDDGQGAPQRIDCLDKIAEKLSEKLGRPIRLGEFSSPQGRPATRIYQALHGGSEFVDKAKVKRVLGRMEDGSFAILTSAWAGGPNRGGHAWLAIKENGQVRFEDTFSDQTPQWDDDEVLRTAAGFFHADGRARDPLRDVRQLVAAAAIGPVAGPPLDGNGPLDGDSSRGDQWQGEVPQSMVAESALQRRGLTLERAGEVGNPLGLMELATERARDNAAWWDSLTGAEQRALIETIPQHIGNSEGIPATARHAANMRSLEQDRARLQELRDRGMRLTRMQRNELARLNRVDEALTRAADEAKKAGVGGPVLMAFDAMAFGGNGRAVVAFGTDPRNPDPYQAKSVSWHVPGQGITMDQLGPCMGDALNHLQSVKHENPNLNAASIAWIGYDTPSGAKSWRAAGSKLAREGAAILYSDIKAFNAARDVRATDGTRFQNNHIFAHSYGSTTASYAGERGRLATDIRTVTLIGSAGAGRMKHASDFGIGAENVYVAASSRDPFTALGGRRPGSFGRIFGLGLGVDPAMASFGAQRIAAEFSAEMDRARNRGTHNAYYKFVDRTAEPAVRSESLANFGRIATGKKVELDVHRTVDERPWHQLGWRTIEPASGRPLDLDGGTDTHQGDRETRRVWNPRWRDQPTEAVEPAQTGDSDDSGDSDGQIDNRSPAEMVADALAQRGVDSADELMNPVSRKKVRTAEARANARQWKKLSRVQRQALIVGDPQRVGRMVGIPPGDLAVARARANAAWWQSLSPTERTEVINAHPREIGNSLGIYAVDRDTANRRLLARLKDFAAGIQAKLDAGERPADSELKLLLRVNRIDAGLRDAALAAERAGEDPPLLIAFDPLEFELDGRAVVSFGNPDVADSVSWLVPGIRTTIDDLGHFDDPAYFYLPGALEHLQSTQREAAERGENLSVASMMWIGYDSPNDSHEWRVLGNRFASDGGDILYADIRSSNAARDVWAGDGSHFTGNYVFGHSYGSTTVSFAGRDGRLANHIRAVTLLGSPGAGPLKHASDFGIGADNVFVAASSFDPITALGGRTPEQSGRILGRGRGIDPAMDSFGAVRVTSEFSAAMNTTDTAATHRSYYSVVDQTASPPIRTESSANFGRIASGHGDEVHREEHRRVADRRWYQLGWRTVEPAAGRPLDLDGGAGPLHSANRRNRIRINPRWRSAAVTEAARLESELDALEAAADPQDAPEPPPVSTGPSPSVDNVMVSEALALRGVTSADELLNPVSRKKVRTAEARANARWWNGMSPQQRQTLIENDPQLVAGRVGIPSADLAEARARANAAWWAALNPGQRLELVRAYPQQIGNSEGIFSGDRDAANRRMLQRYRVRAAEVQAKLDVGVQPTDGEIDLLVRLNKIDTGLRNAELAATQAGLDAPLLMAFDPLEFGYDGRAVVSFGDPQTVDSVSWLVPGIRSTIDSVNGFYLRGALDHLQSTMREAEEAGKKDFSAASMLWIGYDAPNDSHEWRASGTKLAREGGDILYSDIRAANAARDVWAGDGSHFSNNNIFGHSYGSTTTSFAGQERRLANHIRTVTLIGSPGAGPLRHARDFGIGAHMVFVASSSWDFITALGGRHADQAGRILGRGLGIDPAMDVFGGVRVTSEFPATMNTWESYATHRDYFAYVDTATDPSIRTESLANFGRIAAGLEIQVHHEAPRTAEQRPGRPARTIEPAAGRPLRLDEGTGPAYSADRHTRQRFNPRWGAADAVEAQRLAAELDELDNVEDAEPAAVDIEAELAKVAAENEIPDTEAQSDTEPEADSETESSDDTDLDDKTVADRALAKRIPPVRADELRNTLAASVQETSARARNNARWWDGLSDREKQALIGTYSLDIGNSEGIPPADRDTANRQTLQELRERADEIQSRQDRFERTSRAERASVKKLIRFEEALAKAARDAKKAGVKGPVLLAFDPSEFGGDGSAMVGFGDDAYTADKVSWHVPGVQTTLDSLFGFYTTCALNHVVSVREASAASPETATQTVASIAWFGYDTPSGSKLWRAMGTKFARLGGDRLHNAISTFNAGRDAHNGGDSHFKDNDVFGYSYGSTTTGFAGHGGRLSNDVRTVSLVGSPGAGPQKHASDFGIGADNVFVLSSSRDMITALGGRTPSSSGRILGIGLGIDPAMDSFGAVRVTAEAAPEMNRPLILGTHHTYYLGGEALANLGRIGAGRHQDLEHEPHRTTGKRRGLLRTVELAGDRTPRRFGNPVWLRGPNCAESVASDLSDRYGRPFELPTKPSRKGMLARALYEAVGTDVDFTTYEEVRARLIELGDGSAAVLTSRWRGGRGGGHAYLAVNDGNEIFLIDRHSPQQRSGWPPSWGQDAVSRTVVGYLDSNGRPVGRTDDVVPLRLDAADEVGLVRGVRSDPDFVRRQQEYRAQDPTTRRVDTRYADDLRDVVNKADDIASARQLARDLSGYYGRYRIEFEANRFGNEVMLTGKMFDGDTEIGVTQRSFNLDADRKLVASHTGLVIKEDFKHLRGKGFSRSFTSELERFYVHSGVDRIELRTHAKGGYAWARMGYTWDLAASKLRESRESIIASAKSLMRDVEVESETWKKLDKLIRDLGDPNNRNLAEPIDIAILSTDAEPELGRKILEGVGKRPTHGINYVRYMPTAADPDAKSGSRFGAWLKRTLGIGSDPDANCAQVIADVLSARHGRTFSVPVPRPKMGVPAWAVFEAVDSGAEFQTNDEVESALLRLGDGASAVLTSRWAVGRQPGHAYLALNNDNQIYYYDPHTRKLSPWPPPWDAATVARTAVGYLDRNGDAVRPLHDVPLQLAAADTIGDVKGPVDDSDFSRRQAEYRRQDPRTRLAQARFAQTVREVMADPDTADQLAADLSGIYGPCRIEMTQEHFDEGDVEDQMWAVGRGIPTFGPSIYGDVLFEDEYVGTIHWWVKPGKLGVLTVEHQLFITGDYPVREFTDAVAREIEPYLRRSGAVWMDSTTSGKAAYAAAARGETWNPDPELLAQSLNEVKRSAGELWAHASDATRRVLDEIVTRLDPDGTDIPTPIELAALAAPDQPHLGRQLLEGTGIYDADYDDILDETQLHTVNDLQGNLSTWLPADDPADGLVDPIVAPWDPTPADTFVPGLDEARLDPNFASHQQVYRNDDPATRQVQTIYADPLGAVIDSESPVAATRLAADLTGVYGDYRVEFAVSGMQDYGSGRIQLTGDIMRGDEVVGGIGTMFFRDTHGHLVVDNAMTLDHEDDAFEDVAREIDSALEPFYWRSGVHRIEEEVVDDTGRAAVARGYTWNPDPAKLAESLDNMTRSARALGREVGEEARAALRDVVARLRPTHPDLPSPADLDSLSVASEPELGARLLADTNWWAVKYRPATETSGHIAPRTDVALDFVSRQAEYRMKLPSTRQVEAHYAQPFGDVVDSLAPRAAAQLGEDLTGQYGPFGVEFEGRLDRAGRVVLEGDIVNGDVEIGAVAFTFARDDADNLTVLHELHITGELADGAEASQRLIAELAPSFIASGIDQIVTTTHGQTTLAAIDLSERWDTDPQRLQDTVANLTRSAQRLMPDVADDARILLEDVVRRLHAGGDQLPSPVELASLQTAGEPDLGRRLLDGTGRDHDGTGISGVNKLWNVDVLTAGHNCGPWALAELSAIFGVPYPLNVVPSERGVPARALFEAIRSRADFMTYAEVERLLSQLKPTRPGERGPAALLVSSWVSGAGQGGHAYLAVYENGRVQLRDAFTGAPSRWPPYWGEDAVSRTAVGILNSDGTALRGLDTGPDPYAAADEIGFVQGSPDPLGLPHYSPGTLSDAEARAAYIDGERRMHELNERLIREGVGIEERARMLSGLRDSLRAWTRDLMSNRGVAEFLATYEGNPTFEDLVARNEARGLVGDAVYEAVIATATHGHHPPGTLSDIETTALYTEFELRMRDYNERLIGDGVSAEQRARTLSELRNSLRAWTRELMSNQVVAEFLTAYEGNPTFEDLVARNESKGLAGDAVYEAIIHSATHSHYAKGTLTDDETRTVYTTFELRMGEVHAQLVSDGAGAEQRARTMYGMRAALRSWTRALMENRELAEYLNANEPNPTFEALVERQRTKKGLTGDAIFEAIVASSMRSRSSVNEALGIDPENPPPLPPMRGANDGD